MNRDNSKVLLCNHLGFGMVQSTMAYEIAGNIEKELELRKHSIDKPLARTGTYDD